MYTYVFAYYLRKNNQSVIFEDNQKDVESATETLSEYLERDITQENLADIKQKVQDKYRLVILGSLLEKCLVSFNCGHYNPRLRYFIFCFRLVFFEFDLLVQ